MEYTPDYQSMTKLMQTAWWSYYIHIEVLRIQTKHFVDIKPVYLFWYINYILWWTLFYFDRFVSDRNKLRCPSGRSHRSAETRVRHMGKHRERGFQDGFHGHYGPDTSAREHGQSKNRVIELILTSLAFWNYNLFIFTSFRIGVAFRCSHLFNIIMFLSSACHRL